jgi:hypothetical protein
MTKRINFSEFDEDDWGTVLTVAVIFQILYWVVGTLFLWLIGRGVANFLNMRPWGFEEALLVGAGFEVILIVFLVRMFPRWNAVPETDNDSPTL